jgi:hypothetical protein
MTGEWVKVILIVQPFKVPVPSPDEVKQKAIHQ